MDYKNEIKNYFEEELKIISSINIDELNNCINLLEETRLNGGTIYVFGNGGSAATASHMKNDFDRGISQYVKQKYNFNCLVDNISTIMAIANDDCYDNIFINQIKDRLKPNDIALAISASGNSKNVINAVEYMKYNGNKIIGFTGYDGGKLKKLSDINLHVDLNNVQITEDIHLMFNHCMMYILSNSLKKGC